MHPRQIGSVTCYAIASLWTLVMGWRAVQALLTGFHLLQTGSQDPDYVKGGYIGLIGAGSILFFVWLIPFGLLLLVANSWRKMRG